MLKKYIYPLLVLCAFCTNTLANEFTKEQKQNVRDMIKSYLMENPDVLAEALENMQFHLQAEALHKQKNTISQNAKDLYHNAHDHSIGAENAPITIVEFFDYNCGYCKRNFDTVMQIQMENPDVRIVFKEFPILSELSQTASQYALAIKDKTHYIAFHSALMQHSGRLSEARIRTLVSESGADIQAVDKARNDATIKTHIENTHTLARKIGIMGTPAFIIGDTLYPGALEKEELERAIELARTAK